ncbi:MAG: M48 family metalloprotease [Parvibaculaceae bacterium]|nr:M48 family metalloprotease [Parvibaculaceae bacterium]
MIDTLRPGLARYSRALLVALLIWSLLLPLSTGPARADDLALIQDAETEALLWSYATPIFKAAGIDPKAVHIYLVNGVEVNAFVAGGQRLFLNTGLITYANSPNQIAGVIAHETGHMAGGHLIRGGEMMGSMRLPMILAAVLGIGAMAAGAGGAGMAIITGGSQVAQRSLLAYSRMQESQADQAGATFLQKAGMSGRGMLDLFASFRDQEAISSDRQDPFVRSHPISEDRLSALRNRVEASPYFSKTDSPEAIHALKMVQAKLHGFMDQPEITLRRYPDSDTTDYACYGRAVAYHQLGDTPAALKQLEPLFKRMPENPYLWELKGQILFESGQGAEAVPFYEQAVRLAPDSAQILLGLGQAILSVDNGKQAAKALPYLDKSVKLDSENPFTYFQLANAYGQLNNEGMAEFQTANYYYALGDLGQARMHALRASKLLKSGSPPWIQALDILQDAN